MSDLLNRLHGLLPGGQAVDDQQPNNQALFDAVNNMESQTDNRVPQDGMDIVRHPRHITEALRFVKEAEGFKRMPYPDGDKYALGYGTQEHPNNDYPVQKLSLPITPDEAELGVLKKLTELDKGVKGPGFDVLNPNQRAAVLSALYNLTPKSGNQLKKRISEAMQAGDVGAAGGAFGLFVKGKAPGSTKLTEMLGLIRRRTKERRLFDTPYNHLKDAIDAGLGKEVFEVPMEADSQHTAVRN